MESLIEPLTYAIQFLIRTVFLLIALWFMVKVQKFQYNFLGLLGSAALASILDMIPIVGHFIALPVLYLCLIKVTREDLSGVVFTAGISYALVFVMNLFLLATLMGDLRSFATRELVAEAKEKTQETNPSDDEADDEMGEAPAPKVAPLPPPQVRPADQGGKGKNSNAWGFKVKGVAKSARNSSAIIFSGRKNYSISLGESLQMETVNGGVTVTLKEVGESSVVLNVRGEEVQVSR